MSDEIEFPGPKKKPYKIGSVRTIDLATGEVTEEKRDSMMMLPPSPDVCQECAADHPHDQPHNQQSLYYQYSFHARHGRWPTWTDAMAHCPFAVQDAWRPLLRATMARMGLSIPEDLKEDDRDATTSPG